jgi:hypothetical protein
MHMMYPVSIITTIKNLFTRRIIIIIIFKKKKKKIALKEIWMQTQYTAVAQLSSSFNEAYY